jgi:hypothetical protein
VAQMWYDNDFPRLLADRDQESSQELTNTLTETIEVLQNGAKFSTESCISRLFQD